MFTTINNTLFKKIIIAFWAIWWLIALWTDAVGTLAHLGWLHASWAPDVNYPSLVASLTMYHLPAWLPPLLFLGILLWSALCTISFIWASCALKKTSDIWMKRAQIAFVISLTYWLAFFLADQLVMKFALEQNHMVQGGFELLTYLAFYILPT